MRTDITTKNTTTYTLTDADFKRALEAIGVVFNEGTTLQFLPSDDCDYNEEWEFTPGPAEDMFTVTTVFDVSVPAPAPAPVATAPVKATDLRPGTIIQSAYSRKTYTLDRPTGEEKGAPGWYYVGETLHGAQGWDPTDTILDPEVYTLVSVGPEPTPKPVTERDLRPGTVVQHRGKNYTITERSTRYTDGWEFSGGMWDSTSALLNSYTLVSVGPEQTPKNATLCGVNRWSEAKGNIDVYRLDPPLADGTEYVTPGQSTLSHDMWCKAVHIGGGFMSWSGVCPDPKVLAEYVGLPEKPSSLRDPKALVPGCVVELTYAHGGKPPHHQTIKAEHFRSAEGWGYESGGWDLYETLADPEVCRIVSWPTPTPEAAPTKTVTKVGETWADPLARRLP